MQKGLCTNPSNKQGAEYTNSGVYHGSVWRESRKCQREPALHAGAGKALENCRQRLQLQDLPWTDQNFTLSLPAPGPTSPTSAVSFPPRVLIIKDENAIRSGKREQLQTPARQKSCFWSSKMDKLLLTSSVPFKVYWGFLGDWAGAGARGLASAAPAPGAPCFSTPCECPAEDALSERKKRDGLSVMG